MKRFAHFMVFSNVLVSFSAALLTSGLLHYHASSNWFLYGLISFLGVFTVYNFQRIYKAKKGQPTVWLSWVSKHESLLMVLTVISGLCLSYFMVYIEIKSVLIFFLIGSVAFISLFYVIPIGAISLRELPFIKSFLISIVWVSAIIIFPLINNNQLSMDQNWMVIGAYFIYFYALTIPSDIRDRTIDSPSLKTLPQLIGVSGSKWVVFILLIVFAFMVTFRYTTCLFWIPITIHLWLVLKIKNERSETYYALIDSCIAGIGLSYFLL